MPGRHLHLPFRQGWRHGRGRTRAHCTKDADCPDGQRCADGACLARLDGDPEPDRDEADTEEIVETVEAEEVVAHGPLLVFSQGALDFGLMAVGGSTTRSLVYTNKGDANLTIYTARLDQAQPASGTFTLDTAIQTPLTLAPEEALTLVIRFTRGVDGLAVSHMSFRLQRPRKHAEERSTDLGKSGPGQAATRPGGR